MNAEREQFQKDFGLHLAALRKKAGVTQEQLAHEVGVHRTYIGFIEQGKRNPTVGTMYKIASALNLSLNEFFKPF